MNKKFIFYLLAALISAVVVSVRFYDLDLLQAEVYGDINIIHEYLADVVSGKWPFYFTLSAGPLYHYLIAPIILLLGKNYFAIKVSSVLVSLLAIFGAYKTSSKILNPWFGIVVTLLVGTSSWFLIFSRLGNSQIIAPTLSIFAFLFFVEYTDSKKIIYIILSGIVCGLGFYGYPQTFAITPAIGLCILSGIFLFKLPKKSLLFFSLAVILTAAPFLWILKNDFYNFTSGYIGGKAKTEVPILQAIYTNFSRGVLGYFTLSDSNFRSNPAGQPLIALFTAIFFVLGFIFFAIFETRWLLPISINFVVLQLPSWLVLGNPGEIPSASRTLGAAPFVFIFVAGGIWLLAATIEWVLEKIIGNKISKVIAAAFVIIITPIISYREAPKYFNLYIKGLPYENTPIARPVVDFVKSLPQSTPVHIIGCCWETGMPEPKGIEFELPHPEDFYHIEKTELFNCNSLQSYPIGSVFIWDYKKSTPLSSLAECESQLSKTLHSTKDGKPLFYSGVLGSINQFITPLPTVSPAL